ncbi:related to Putative sterigmatocystin biosynthesis lipase/esterase STCI [Phialocephala subalpina]|uniref:Related to Putative sterigmatocystin biosynthesis lipase/esterase STCI n=1 Tax=Phialocephala subalpina TaxID=576137 RepID=A0A1L7XCK8_9HELO|nr:related to Putative sterigmatocystin biosynthesis lipase/esterase STCI [Phialocephala subalpina]
MASISEIPSNWSTLATLNPEFVELMKTLPPGFQIVTEKTTVEDLRAQTRTRPQSEPWPDVEEKNLYIAMRDGFENRIRVYSLEEGNGPLLVMIHGGGFCLGMAEQEETHCRNWVRSHRGVAVSIEHRLAPEVEYPVPVEDCWDILKWIAANTGTLKADPTKGFVLGGTSSGSSAVMVLSHLARDEDLSPPLTGLFLCLLMPCQPTALPPPHSTDPRIVSWTECRDTPMFNHRAFSLFSDSMPCDPFSPLRSPMLWESGHAGLPKTYFSIAGADMGRDFALVYEEVLRGEGVMTKVDVFPGLPHGFWGFFPKSDFARDFWTRSEEAFVWLLENGDV